MLHAQQEDNVEELKAENSRLTAEIERLRARLAEAEQAKGEIEVGYRLACMSPT